MIIRTFTLLFAFTTVSLLSTAPTKAHHGRASYTDEIISLDATVTNFRFVNPHVQIYFDVTSDSGEIEQWQAELTAPNRLARGGWTKNTLQPGYEIKISGRVARNNGKSVAINEIIMPDGQRIPLREVLD
jgi:hypothetical protein